ncbi:unnamed protein product [Effrenium voratum]|nr:unnamed protein product [Effrenium voratum]
MDIIASRGVETFTRAAEDFQRCLDKPANAQRYHGGFHAWASSQFQKVQDAMVRIWLEQGERERPAQGMAEDVAGHFKDLIKMQDKELRDLRAEVQQLKSENHELRKLTTDEDKTLLLWKVGALTKQCEALQVQCDLLQASRSSVEVARLRERQALREQRQELEQQLQVLALALDEADLATAKEPSEEPSQASQCQIIEMDERDELLAVLSQIHRSCPEAAAFLAPLGRFAAPEVKVSAWEDAADRLGRQAEAVSVLATSHGQRVSELKEQQEQRKQHEGQHQGYSHANKGSPHGSDSRLPGSCQRAGWPTQLQKGTCSTTTRAQGIHSGSHLGEKDANSNSIGCNRRLR